MIRPYRKALPCCYCSRYTRLGLFCWRCEARHWRKRLTKRVTRLSAGDRKA